MANHVHLLPTVFLKHDSVVADLDIVVLSLTGFVAAMFDSEFVVFVPKLAEATLDSIILVVGALEVTFADL
jgi:hypothetical protein